MKKSGLGLKDQDSGHLEAPLLCLDLIGLIGSLPSGPTHNGKQPYSKINQALTHGYGSGLSRPEKHTGMQTSHNKSPDETKQSEYADEKLLQFILTLWCFI